MQLIQVCHYVKLQCTKTLSNEKGQFALDIALGLAVVLVISAFIIMPGLRTLSTGFMTNMTNWWNNTISDQIFRTKGN